MSTTRDQTTRLSYATLLTSPTTMTHLDKQPLPWFSSEVRQADDPRVKWLDFTVSEEKTPLIEEQHTAKEHHHPSNRSNHSIPNISEQQKAPFLNKQEVQTHAEEAVAGHYLDHIETVQKRDHGQDRKQGRRKRKPRSNKSNSLPVEQHQASRTTQKKQTQTNLTHKKQSGENAPGVQGQHASSSTSNPSPESQQSLPERTKRRRVRRKKPSSNKD